MNIRSFLLGMASVGLCALDAYALIPRPQQMKRGGGEFETRAQTVGEAAKSALFERDVTIQPEGYAVNVTEKGITVRSSDESGAFYAVKTLEQLGRKKCVVFVNSHSQASIPKNAFGRKPQKRQVMAECDIRCGLLHRRAWKSCGFAFPGGIGLDASKPGGDALGEVLFAESVENRIKRAFNYAVE